MRLMSTSFTYLPTGFNPLPRPLLVRIFTILIQNLNPMADKRAFALLLPVWLARSIQSLRQWHSMVDRLLAAAVLPYKRHGRGEYAFPSLPCLYGSRCIGFPFPDVLDIIHNWYLRIPGENEVAMHAVHCEVRRDGTLGCGKALCDYGAAVDAACSGGVPERSGVGVEVLVVQD